MTPHRLRDLAFALAGGAIATTIAVAGVLLVDAGADRGIVGMLVVFLVLAAAVALCLSDAERKDRQRPRLDLMPPEPIGPADVTRPGPSPKDSLDVYDQRFEEMCAEERRAARHLTGGDR